MAAHRSLEETFWLKTDRRGPDECWPWLGSTNHKGYGNIARKVGGRYRYTKASHVAWSLRNGRPFPADKQACHRCDNPSCVNPAHIWPGTAAENAADRDQKGRHGRGSRPRLTECARGHAFTPENTGASGRSRYCRACRRRAEHVRNQRSKSAQ